ncbi:hypothetical protein B0H16DRAFT_1459395 [Mycena metata]|uniref:Uncharacterized protein n=1 Tax=Mycena metata TaxID=1033252 RepID=A0AAD7IZB9_9AGAR|nr:hypothetical protein B0H16DRAFT_1459395 [Mycena metata]
MSILPNAGIAALIPDTFDFHGWMTVGPVKDPTGRSLRFRNTHNLSAERFNEISIDTTLNCRDDRSNFPDVGPRLRVFYGYLQDDMTDMVLSEPYCTDVGPLPAFIRQQVDRTRRKRTERVDTEKAEKEKEKTKGRPLVGSMVLSNPIFRVAGQRPDVVISDVVLQSIVNKFYVPLHWFSDERLHTIQFHLHDVPTKLIRPEPTQDQPSPDKVLVFDMQRMMQTPAWGSDELSSSMSPLKWQQCSQNFESALLILSEKAPADDPTKRTFATEYRGHRLFFVKYDKFEENFPDWYGFEREARHAILRGVTFDSDYYAHQVDGILHAKWAAALYMFPESPGKKRTGEREPDSYSSKVPRQTNNSPSSFPRDSSPPRGDPSSFRNNNGAPRGPSCLVCDGPHRLKSHPPATTSFADGPLCFSQSRNGELWTARPFKGPDVKQICIEYNLPQGCRRIHDTLHACSLCGKEHAALPRNAQCSRSGR